jgi:hypothetical protein
MRETPGMISFQNLEAFANVFVADDRLTRDVSAWPRKARHKTEFDGVATRGHDDRRCPGGALSG